MTAAATLARAIELDDDHPDNVCPGCGQDITGWQTAATIEHRGPCLWDRDYLVARQFRRRLIAGANR